MLSGLDYEVFILQKLSCKELFFLFAGYENAASSSVMLCVRPTKSLMRNCPSPKKVQNIRLGQIGELDCFSFAEMVVIVGLLWWHPCSTSHLSLLGTPVYFRRRRCSMTSLLSGSLSSSTTSVASLFLRRSDLTRLAGLRMLRNLPTRTTVKALVSRDSLRAAWFSSAGRFSVFACPQYRKTPCTNFFSLLPCRDLVLCNVAADPPNQYLCPSKSHRCSLSREVSVS